MPKQIIIAEQHHIAAVFSEDQIQELVVATGRHQIGDIYLGVVENVLPGIDAAFVNIGDTERNGFIHVTDLGPLKLKRTAGAITELLAPQQKVLVQVMKEPTGNKGPRLTGNITLPGRYVVLMPFGRGVNLSRRIKNENERNRLRALAILIKPAGMGLLVRTEAEGKPEEAIMEDLELLQRQWEAILQEAQSTRAPSLLNRDDDFIQRVLRDMYGADVNRIVVDSNTGLKRVKQYLINWSGGQAPQGLLIDHHRDRIAILEYFRINAAIREALKPRVDLPSGGYVIIEPTEALTVVDVNSGSFTRSATARETVLWTNCEAATEIARQLRLRNLAGVIIVDFIDMESRKDQLQVLEHFNKALKADKARPQIAQLSELGLVELTRKRQGQNIYELFGRPCPTCGGLGHLVHLPGEPDRDAVAAPRNGAERAVGETLRLAESRDYTEPTADYNLEPGDNEFANLNILNHPSYQELGESNKNRRTRRRLIGRGEGSVKDEPRMPSTPMNLVNERDQDLEQESESSTSEISLPVTGKNNWIERTERSRPAKPEPVKPTVAEPPEIVSVEMTPEEQEIYAMMGVSPLVHVNRTVKNSRSLIINVVLPGQAASESAEDDFVTPSQPQPVTISPQAPVEFSDTDNTEESSVATVTDESESESDTGGTVVTRRRRRRSSAVENRGEE
ncbi:Rne/Rng family ribonuclease [Gloeocapsopsis sp. IPPAS B-1203]|uniref:Rne/Rng family ribonuclease n=1 Tax=Gloeocapsopsis sp. IPPAS B-1203 TaxID=2049454 RepID=UPI000C18DB82|nr:Rne/Rng family ribonuclease [Gloeocapsopsis sp. IPPAS B-1203]PIG93463.1 ribonuclease E/G [Gloeocapsopsis sp. IPPAS B-1203]